MEINGIVWVVVIWTLCAIGAMLIAQSKGRQPVFYFFVGLVLGIIGIFIAAALPTRGGSSKAQRSGLPASWLNGYQRTPTLDKGRLTVDAGGLSFKPIRGEPWVIPIEEITGTQVLSRGDAPYYLPRQDELFKGVRSVLVVSRQYQGQVFDYIFSGPSSLIEVFTTRDLEPIRSKSTRLPVIGPCPFCGELISIETIKCRFCGSDLARV